MSVAAALAIVATLLALSACAELSRWWRGTRVLARLDRPSHRRPAPAILVQGLERAGIDGDPRVHFDCWIGAIALGAVAANVFDGGIIALLAVAVGPPTALVAMRGRGARRRAAQVPVALDAIAGHLRGGSALRHAIRDAAEIGGPLGAELGTVARHARDGVPIEEAIDDWARRHDAATSLAGAALTMAASIGGPGADAVESAAASLRQRAAATAEVAALSVQARLSAIVLSVAPVGFTFLLVSLDPSSARFLLATPAGWACIAGGVGLDIVGALWMQRLVGRAA